MAFNLPAFFREVRAGILGPTLDNNEVEGCKALLVACEGWPVSWTAYALATAYHETAHTMQPVKEYGGDKYFFRMYDKAGARPEVAKRLGNTQPGDGITFCGRGYVQLTGRRNYALAEKATGKPLVDQPYLAQRVDIASEILRHGMSQGWFTGKKNSTYLPSSGPAEVEQFMQARRIINGTDKAALIASYAMKFQSALTEANWT